MSILKVQWLSCLPLSIVLPVGRSWLKSILLEWLDLSQASGIVSIEIRCGPEVPLLVWVIDVAEVIFFMPILKVDWLPGLPWLIVLVIRWWWDKTLLLEWSNLSKTPSIMCVEVWARPEVSFLIRVVNVSEIVLLVSVFEVDWFTSLPRLIILIIGWWWHETLLLQRCDLSKVHG